MCGKYEDSLAVIKIAGGSPPRVWEVPYKVPMGLLLFRITPTCVGSTY